MIVLWLMTASRKPQISPSNCPNHLVLETTVLTPPIRECQYGQDIFTLRSTYFAHHPQAPIHMHWRRFHVSSIPLSTPESFHLWLLERWNEKETLMAAHAKTGHFPSRINDGESIATAVRLGHWWEIGQLGAVLVPLIAIGFAGWRMRG